MKKFFVLLIALFILAGFWLFGSYNRLITLDASVSQQWAQVETQYQRRFDLIPNLVNTVQGVMNQEKQIFADIAQARTRYSGATTIADKTEATNQVESALSRLLVIMENYPQLKSNESANKLMDELAGTENRISVERGRFNESATVYNLAVRTVPGNIVAAIFGFQVKPLFTAAAAAATPPTVKFE